MAMLRSRRGLPVARPISARPGGEGPIALRNPAAMDVTGHVRPTKLPTLASKNHFGQRAQRGRGMRASHGV